MAKKNIYYKILTEDNEPAHEGVCTYSLPTKKNPGDWMPDEVVYPCRSGYHVVTAEYIPSWLVEGGNVYIAEGRGVHIVHSHKHVFESIRLVKKVGQLPYPLDEVDSMNGDEILNYISNPRLVQARVKENKEFRSIRKKLLTRLSKHEERNSRIDCEDSFMTGFILADPVYKRFSVAKRIRLLEFIRNY